MLQWVVVVEGQTSNPFKWGEYEPPTIVGYTPNPLVGVTDGGVNIVLRSVQICCLKGLKGYE